MKLFTHQITQKHVGHLCLFSFRTEEWGYTGHSAQYGLEGSGVVKVIATLLGRLCMVTEGELIFLNAAVYSNPLTLGSSPHGDVYASDYLYSAQKASTCGKVDVYASEHGMLNLLKRSDYAEWSKTWQLARKLNKL